METSASFGPLMAAEAQERHFYQAGRRAFVADGSAYNWSIHRGYFADFEPITDFLHAVCYVYRCARAVSDDEVASANRLLKGTANGRTPDDFASTAEVLVDAAASAGDIDRLEAVWFHRMLFGPDPVGERLALVWNDHFATGNAKVRNARAMHRQNELFRTGAPSSPTC